jgi:hypothetical protein
MAKREGGQSRSLADEERLRNDHEAASAKLTDDRIPGETVGSLRLMKSSFLEGAERPG